VVLATTAHERGGTWRHIEDLALELRERGHEVALALSPAAPALRAAAVARGLPTIAFAPSVARRGWVWHGHLHDTYDRSFLLAALARRSIGPVVLTEHLPRTNASDPSLLPGPRHPLAGPAKTAFKRVQFACADAVIAPSPGSAEFLARRYGARERVHVVAHGLRAGGPPASGELAAPSREAPAAARLPAPPPGAPLRVLCTGAVITQKGHDVLVKAAGLARGRWRATVVGDGPNRARLAREAAEAGVPVEFPGWCDDVESALAGGDVVCLPSRWESAGYAALEAMRAGLALVVSDVDGLRDIVEHEVTGLIVPPGDPGALAAALDRLAGDRELAHRLGAAGRTRSAQWTSARMATQTLAVYESALARRAPRA